MLSPASLRVCCLAVMAPALTKADRQADCLPVVLSESFCVSDTTDTFSGENRLSEIRQKCAATPLLHTKRKNCFMKSCSRYAKTGLGLPFKPKCTDFSSKSFLYASIGLNSNFKCRKWPGTKALTAYADKIKLKYTMNKHTTNVRKMGLAKANTSIGLNDLKMKHAKENLETVSNPTEVGVQLTDSVEETSTLISDNALSKDECFVNLVESKVCEQHEVSDEVESSTQIFKSVTESESEMCKVEVADSKTVGMTDKSVTLTNVTLSEQTECLETNASKSCLFSSDSLQDSMVPTSSCDVLQDSIETTRSCDVLQDSTEPTRSCDVLQDSTEPVRSCDVLQDSTVPDRSCNVLQDSTIPTRSCDVLQDLTVPIRSSGILQDSTLPTEPYGVLQDSTIPTSSCDLLCKDILHTSSEAIIKPADSLPPKRQANFDFSKFTDVRIPFMNSKYSGSSPLASSIFSTLTCVKLLSNAKKLSHISERPVPVIPDTRYGLQYFIHARKEHSLCCLPPSEELESLEESLEDDTKLKSLYLSTCVLLQKYLYIHAKIQLEKFVEYYQRKFRIPCQQQQKPASSKPGKDSDIKAELLKSDDVKHLSTAVLVSLVRKMGTGSQPELFPPKATISNSETDSFESTEVALTSEEVAEIKKTTGQWLKTLQALKKDIDPDCTESSADETENEADDANKANTSRCAFSKFLRKRAAICSRASWLISRYHEVDYRLKQLNERWADIWRAQGSVSLENTKDSDSHTLGLLSTKGKVKNSMPPLNGCLDYTALSQLDKSAFQDPFSVPLDRTEDSSRRDEEIESCSRIQPLDVTNFRKRKLVLLSGLQEVDSKFSRLCNVSCNCKSLKNFDPCILCAGERNRLQSVDPDSMSIRERVAILDPYFHPVLSTKEEIPAYLHWDNTIKSSSKYQNVRPVSPQNIDSQTVLEENQVSSGFRSRRRLSRYARSLSAKYRNKHRRSKHLRKHKLIFGNWRRLQNKNALHSRRQFRKYSVRSSDVSSPESPEPSPISEFDEGYGYENLKRKRDDSQFDIDDVILPCSSRNQRLVEIQYKEIMIPKWRCVDVGPVLETDDDVEVISDAYLTRRHEMLEIEEKERMKRSPLGLSRRSRRNRCDSRAESSGANTPDAVSLFNQDLMFHPPDSANFYGPTSPLSPATPSSVAISDDSQTASGSGLSTRIEKKKTSQKVQEDNVNTCNTDDIDEILPFEPFSFPLDDEVLEELLNESDHYKEIIDQPFNLTSFPASPTNSTSSTSTVDEDEDLSDPEWTVVKPKGNGLDQTLVLKFAKR